MKHFWHARNFFKFLYDCVHKRYIDPKFVKLALSDLKLTIKNPNSSKIERVFSNFRRIHQHIFRKIGDLKCPI